MKKLVLQFLVFISVFFASWYMLSRVDWMTLFHVAKLSKENQEKLGAYIFKAYTAGKERIEDKHAEKIVADLKNKICLANRIDTAAIHTYVFKDHEVNAFAIPGGNIIVNTSLIGYCDNPDMLACILAHEIAHIEKEHISKKLVREIGLTSLLMMAGGTQNAEIIKKILHTLTSTNFERKDESEADKTAVGYVHNAGIDPTALAAFFDKIGNASDEPVNVLDWISTHPGAAERATKVRQLSKNRSDFKPALDSATWVSLKYVAQD